MTATALSSWDSSSPAATQNDRVRFAHQWQRCMACTLRPRGAAQLSAMDCRPTFALRSMEKSPLSPFVKGG